MSLACGCAIFLDREKHATIILKMCCRMLSFTDNFFHLHVVLVSWYYLACHWDEWLDLPLKLYFPCSWQVWRIKLTLSFLWETFAMLFAFLKRRYLHHSPILNLNSAREGRTTSAGSHCLPKKFKEGASAYSCTSSNYRGKKRAPWKFKHTAWKRRTGTTWSRITKSPESWRRETAPGGKGKREGAYPARAWANQKEDCSWALGAD